MAVASCSNWQLTQTTVPKTARNELPNYDISNRCMAKVKERFLRETMHTGSMPIPVNCDHITAL
jgi:hypothetical protein